MLSLRDCLQRKTSHSPCEKPDFLYLHKASQMSFDFKIPSGIGTKIGAMLIARERDRGRLAGPTPVPRISMPVVERKSCGSSIPIHFLRVRRIRQDFHPKIHSIYVGVGKTGRQQCLLYWTHVLGRSLGTGLIRVLHLLAPGAEASPPDR